jgi:hypothetical protein
LIPQVSFPSLHVFASTAVAVAAPKAKIPVRGKASGTTSVMIKTRATKMSKFLVVWRIEPSSSATRRPIESPRMRIVNRAYISSMIARHKLDDEERTRTAYNNTVLNLG